MASRYWRITFEDTFLSWWEIGSLRAFTDNLPMRVRDRKIKAYGTEYGRSYSIELEFYAPVRLSARAVRSAFNGIDENLSCDLHQLRITPFPGEEVDIMPNYCAPCA